MTALVKDAFNLVVEEASQVEIKEEKQEERWQGGDDKFDQLVL